MKATPKDIERLKESFAGTNLARPVSNRQFVPAVVRECHYYRNCERCHSLRPRTFMNCKIRR